MSEKFEYKYSAPTPDEKKEINSIRNKYLPKNKEVTKLDRLRALDNKVKTVPEILAISCGVIGILVFGTGLTCILEWNKWLVGIICAILGLVLIAISYPLYNFVFTKNKAKYEKEIIQLSNELLNEDNNNWRNICLK